MASTLETHYLDLNDVRLAYCEHGKGPDLLLLHGNSQSKRIFLRYQLDHFADFHTIAVDSPGHGQSTCGHEGPCYSGCCDATCRLCAQLGIHHANILGYSDGANIALLMAKHAPHVIEKAVLISPNYRVEGMKPLTIWSIRVCVRALDTLARLGLGTRKASLRMAMMLEDLPITEEELQSLEVDISILYAEKEVIREGHLHQLANVIPSASLVRVNSCRHLTILDHRQTIRLARRAFLS